MYVARCLVSVFASFIFSSAVFFLICFNLFFFVFVFLSFLDACLFSNERRKKGHGLH